MIQISEADAKNLQELDKAFDRAYDYFEKNLPADPELAEKVLEEAWKRLWKKRKITKEQEAIYFIKKDIETQEHIKALAIANDTRDFDCQKRIDAYTLAVEALEKQLPKKPRIESLGYAGFCTVCGKEFGWHVNYCERCGQRLDWGDEQ